MAGSAQAQRLSEVLTTIEANNTSLAALRGENVASVAQMASETSIVGPTSVEYSPFFGNGAKGIASSELIVAQEFEFPSLGGMRNASVQAQERVLDQQYRAARRDILVEAKKLCYDLSHAVQTRNLLLQRERTTDSLLMTYEKSVQLGRATVIDVNRIKMDRMAVHTQLVQAQGDIATITGQLESLNGGQKLNGVDNLVLEMEPMGDPQAMSAEENIAQAQLDAAQHDIKLAKNGWLPSLKVGYRRNTELNEAVNGFVVGVALPSFGNGKKVKAAQARRNAAQAQIDNARAEAQSRISALRTEATTLRATIDSYDLALMRNTLALINKAIGQGALTVSEYYAQTDRIYDALAARLDLENRYNKVVTDLNRENL